MGKYVLLSIFLLSILIIGMGSVNQTDNQVAVPYPTGYREWTHVKTGVIGPQSSAFSRFGGFHHIYANDKALQGYESGKFPEGSFIVFDVIEMIDDGKGNILEGKRKFIDVMVKDSRYDSTGGWGFEEFNGNSMIERNIRELSKTECFNCHARQSAKDFVFSEFRK